MTQEQKLNDPWMVAVWPGMGHVAVSAGYYLMAKLQMHLFAEFSPRELFDLDHVEVKNGLIRAGDLPRSRYFVWKDPWKKRDIIVFIGEAQPPTGKYAFCRRIIDFAQQLGVQRIFTFAAMATQMHPKDDSRVFGATTDEAMLGELRQLELELLENGQIGGLNGVVLGAAAESNLPGTCLLGEMPGVFAQLPFPKASLAVLEVFRTIANLEVDLSELSEQAAAMDEKLEQLLTRVEHAMEQSQPADEPFGGEQPEEASLSEEDRQRIEVLFSQAAQDRSKAYELKRELDQLNVFPEYEDRFLDLFKKPE